ncbi:MAG: aminotransferase class V-fold PLP-dependent enzyme [Geitlerinemataceae cyanobacterium]
MDRFSTSNWRQFWSLDSSVTFLNHGSFGACPIPVLEAQQQFRQQLERQPVRFFVRDGEALLDGARARLAAFLGANPEDLAFVPNATTGVNTVLRSLSFHAEDELLTINHGYNACRNALQFVADRFGARVIVAEIPFPVNSAEEIVTAVMRCVSPRTKLVLLDHITSPTALVLPISELVRQLNERGVETLVDGAHALGMLPLNLRELGATYYAGNCHKWLCAPKGSGFLYVRHDRHDNIRPLTISHGANASRTDRSRFHLEFDWVGTDDPTPYLCIPEAIDFMGSRLPGGWTELMARNHQMAIAVRQLLCETLEVSPPCPESMLGAMAAVPLPNLPRSSTQSGVYIDPLQNALHDRFNIEIPVTFSPPNSRRWLRISSQLYNTLEDYKFLVSALVELKKTGESSNPK